MFHCCRQLWNDATPTQQYFEERERGLTAGCRLGCWRTAAAEPLIQEFSAYCVVSGSLQCVAKCCLSIFLGKKSGLVHGSLQVFPFPPGPVYLSRLFPRKIPFPNSMSHPACHLSDNFRLFIESSSVILEHIFSFLLINIYIIIIINYKFPRGN